ncbi:MAG: hypothetical protein HY049_03135 [Acidobacteria bacterium]|nr:hypothetical protein [Acidobacteriota bacterium]
MDSLHGASGDDAMSGAEALSLFYDRPYNPGNVLRFEQTRPEEFAAYDENNPLRKIFVDANGVFTGNSTGTPFLLNFDAKEGPIVDAALNIHSDGVDRIFGDLGNDWIVGGTGQDHLFGGFGNDLLNADDDHDSTAGTADPLANNVPDTHVTYEDIAYGGAGRDVLIANTGGDRLIDWVGEFNSYLVPFAPFGAFTISRSLSPQLFQYLYDLSSGDGADPTRAADAGTDPARNGEPLGEIGLVTQKDSYWQDQTGAPGDPQAGNLHGGRKDVLRSAAFNTGSFSSFAPDSGVWTVVNGELQVAAASLGGDAASVFDVDVQLPSYFEMLATVRVVKPTAGWKANAYLIFDYQSKTDFKFAGLNGFVNKLQMGHRTAAGWIVDVQKPFNVKSDVNYSLMLALDHSTATLTGDGGSQLSFTYAQRIVDGFAYGLNAGFVGVGSDNSRGAYDDVIVQADSRPATFDTTEDFSDGVANVFKGTRTGSWTISAGRWGATPAAGADRAVSLVDLGLARGLQTAAVLDLSATLRTAAAGGFVFDFYGVDDFKYLIVDVRSGLLKLGHYTAAAGWKVDAQGAAPIASGVDFQLGLTLKGTTAVVTLAGSTAFTYAFNGVTTYGRFGLMTAQGTSSFDTVRIVSDDPALTGVTITSVTQAPAPALTGTALTATALIGRLSPSSPIDFYSTATATRWAPILTLAPLDDAARDRDDLL